MNDAAQEAGARKKSGAGRTKRQKVSKACVYCQRSHMSCNDERPCQRCIKRNIAHMCHDKEPNDASEAQRPNGGENESGAQANALQGVPVVGSNATSEDSSAGAAAPVPTPVPVASTETIVDASVLPILASGHSAMLSANDGTAGLSRIGVPPVYVNDPSGTRSLPPVYVNDPSSTRSLPLGGLAEANSLGSMAPGSPSQPSDAAARFAKSSLLL
ncbi:Transcription factor, partial [Coemansia erecta]